MARTRSNVVRVRIGFHTPSPTTRACTPRRSGVDEHGPHRLGAHRLPRTVAVPVAFSQAVTDRSVSPATMRLAAARMILASAATIVTRSSAQPNGRFGPPCGNPTSAFAVILRRIRSPLCSDSKRAHQPRVRATGRPDGVDRSHEPGCTVTRRRGRRTGRHRAGRRHYRVGRLRGLRRQLTRHNSVASLVTTPAHDSSRRNDSTSSMKRGHAGSLPSRM
jgi:hypothetical protein